MCSPRLGSTRFVPKGAWAPGTLLSSWAGTVLSNHLISYLYTMPLRCSALCDHMLNANPCWTAHTLFDCHCTINVILNLAHLLHINCSSQQLIKKAQQFTTCAPPLIMFSNHTRSSNSAVTLRTDLWATTTNDVSVSPLNTPCNVCDTPEPHTEWGCAFGRFLWNNILYLLFRVALLRQFRGMWDLFIYFFGGDVEMCHYLFLMCNDDSTRLTTFYKSEQANRYVKSWNYFVHL